MDMSRPPIAMTPTAAFAAAVEALPGRQTAMAKLAGKTQSAVSRRLAAKLPIWSDNGLVLKVEEATGISRHVLRPDIYPLEEPPAPSPPPASSSPDGGGEGNALEGVRT